MKNLHALLLVAAMVAPTFAAAPVIESVAGLPVVSGSIAVPLSVPCGKSLVVAVGATDADGDRLAYSVTNSNSKFKFTVRQANPKLRITSTFDGGSGDMELMLFRDFAPVTAGFIGGLAQGGFYDGLKFHRVDPAFVIQGGDPAGNGSGGPGFRFENEFHPGFIFTGSNQLAMANAGYQSITQEATNGSQFFITFGSPRFLDFNHSIFGQLVRGFSTLEAIRNVPRVVITNSNGVITGTSTTPATPVTMTDVDLLPNFTDALLVITASGSGSATFTVAANDGTGASAPVTFRVNGVVDTTNDPPVVNRVAPVATTGTVAKVPVDGWDLESDYLLKVFSFASIPATGTGGFNGKVTKLKINPSPATYRGPVKVAIGVRQLGAGSRGSSANPSDLTTVQIGMGDAPIAASSIHFTGVTGTAVQTVVAAFTDADTSGSAGQYRATVNWGDGVVNTSGSAAVVITTDTSTSQKFFVVTGSHVYSRPGCFPVEVRITGTQGASARVFSSANIVDGGLAVAALPLTARKGKLVDAVVARFYDDAAAGASAYAALVHWGDGAITTGTVVAAGGAFEVVGSHTYRESGRFTTFVEVQRSGDAAHSWGSVAVDGVNKVKFPPFATPNLVTDFREVDYIVAGSGTAAVNAVSLSLIVINGGSKPLAKARVKFHLSNDALLDAGDTALLLRDGTKSVTVANFPSDGGGYSLPFKVLGFFDRRVALPAGASGAGKYLIAEMIYTDPMADCLPIKRYGAFKIPNP
jgi:cyclophilin family peptidyl-prolyl cis-trans isomerase